MNNIEKLFVPYQEALDMMLLGFNEECFYQYVRDFDSNGELIPVISESNYPTIRNNTEISNYSGGDCFAAPTYSQCFSWFREKYYIHGEIFPLGNKWQFQLHCLNKEDLGACYTGFLDIEYLSYPEAELECLKQLIKEATELN